MALSPRKRDLEHGRIAGLVHGTESCNRLSNL
jgi:hypothetical protein